MTWRLAESLKTLRTQLNTMFPERSKISDGSIGDTRHKRSGSKSDHNPDAKGRVRAIDITFDTDTSDGFGVDCHALARVLLKHRDPRIKYIIWNRQITTRDAKGLINGWTRYTGTNPHQHHLHISVKNDPSQDSTAPWNLEGMPENAGSALAARPISVAAAAPDLYTVKKGDTLGAILNDYNLKTNAFMKLNGFTKANFNPDRIRVGDIFKVK